MNEHERITVSRDALRADLLDLELRLTKTLATKSDVDALEKRVATLERKAQAHDTAGEVEDAMFTRGEKRAGLVLAFIAILVQALVESGVIH